MSAIKHPQNRILSCLLFICTDEVNIVVSMGTEVEYPTGQSLIETQVCEAKYFLQQ